MHTRDGREGKEWIDKVLISKNEPDNFSVPTSTKMPTGIYKLKAESQDGGGSSEIEIYVISDEMQKLKDGFALFYDQPEYFVGGKANLLINYPDYKKASEFLITYERGEIIGYQTVKLEKPLSSVEIPITEQMTPNMHISATVIKYPEDINSFIQSQLKRCLQAKQIQSEVEMLLLEQELASLMESDDASQEEIDELNEKIESLKSGNGTLHDSAESDWDIKDIYPEIENAYTEIIVSKREREIYTDITPIPSNPNPGEGLTLQIHTYDYQNRPVQSVVTLNLIKKEQNGILPDIFTYFYKPRVSQILTSSNITLAENQSAGNQSHSFSANPNQSKRISDSAYFNPVILTDENGYAEISLQLPDEYATWNINAVVTNEAKNFGSYHYELPVNKSVLIHPVVPDFITPGDNVMISTMLQNISGEEIEVKVELTADDINVKGGDKKAVKIQAGGTAKLEWNAEINESNEKNSIKLSFNSEYDQAQIILPVKNLSISESLGGRGFLEEELRKNVRISENAIPGTGGLFVSICGSLLNIIDKYTDSINNYHHSYTEKSATDLIAKTILYHPELSDMESKELGDEIRLMADNILNLQKADGGYALWEGAESNPWLTAYVLFALEKAGISGAPQNKAMQFLWNKINEVSISDKLFILWALSEAGQYDTKSTISAFQDREEASIAGNAFLMMNISNLVNAGQRSAYSYLEKIKSEIAGKHTEDEEWVYFEEDDINSQNTNIRTTAIALLALNRMNEENILITPTVNYLSSYMAINQLTPQEGVWAALALSEYMKNQKNTEINFNAEVSVNGDTLIGEHISDKNPDEIYEQFLPLSSLNSPDHTNEIVIEKEGTGYLYFNTDLSYRLSNESISAVEKGMLITRQYYDLEDSEKSRPLKELKTGNLYRGLVTLIIPEDTNYAIIDIPLPAGLKILSLNPAFANPSYYYSRQEDALSKGVSWIDNPIWNFDSFKIENDRLVLFAEDLPAGVYNVDYLSQATTPGKYNHLPATINHIFNSSAYARTEGGWMEVK